MFSIGIKLKVVVSFPSENLSLHTYLAVMWRDRGASVDANSATNGMTGAVATNRKECRPRAGLAICPQHTT
jgi:hypothetical protein